MLYLFCWEERCIKKSNHTSLCRLPVLLVYISKEKQYNTLICSVGSKIREFPNTISVPLKMNALIRVRAELNNSFLAKHAHVFIHLSDL